MNQPVPAPWHRFELSPPWLDPYRGQAQRVVASIRRGATVAQALNDELPTDEPIHLAAGSLRFVDAAQLPAGRAYESHIALTAAVPTRDNRHDLFNGLVWLRFAALKRRLNELQATEIAARGVGSVRGPLRDALTLFDENGALLSAPARLADALRQRDWQCLFVNERETWRDAQLTLFGHALLDKLTAPRKQITAHVLIVDRDVDVLELFTADRLAMKPFAALPVLGVPGWWSENGAPGFYADPAVFREAR
jgi:hypothetical protein